MNIQKSIGFSCQKLDSHCHLSLLHSIFSSLLTPPALSSCLCSHSVFCIQPSACFCSAPHAHHVVESRSPCCFVSFTLLNVCNSSLTLAVQLCHDERLPVLTCRHQSDKGHKLKMKCLQACSACVSVHV